MTPRFSTKALLLAILVVAAIGVLDSVIGEVWDHIALFALAAVPALVLLVRTNPRRRSVTVRNDHARWLATRSQLTGEDFDHVVDRAIATYRYALSPDGGEPDQDVPTSDAP